MSTSCRATRVLRFAHHASLEFADRRVNTTFSTDRTYRPEPHRVGHNGWVTNVLRSASPYTGAVVRSLLGLLATAAIAAYTVSPAAAMWATAVAAIAGVTALQDSPFRRVPLAMEVSVLAGAAVLIGSLAAEIGPVFVGVVALCTFAAGMMWVFGVNAGLVAAAITMLVVVAEPAAASPSEALLDAGVAILAGWTQAALIGVWPPQPWRVQREAMAGAFRSLGADARRMAADAGAEIDPAPLKTLRELFIDSQMRRHSSAYRGGYRLPERIAATLEALRDERDDAALGNQADSEPGNETEDEPGDRTDEAPGDSVRQAFTDAAETLDAIAGSGRKARLRAERGRDRLDAAAATVTGAGATTVQRLADQTRQVVVLKFGRLHRRDLAGTLRSTVDAVTSHLTWTSPILRHSLRLSVTAGAATGVALFDGLDRSYWIGLTLLLVLRPETAHTYTRCAGRIAAIAGGVAVATGITMLFHPTGIAATALAAAFLGLTYAVLQLGYLAVSATLAAAIVFIVDVVTGSAALTLEQQLIPVVVGGSLAVLAHVILPDPALVRLRQRAGELLKTEVDYAATVVKAFVHELDHQAEALSAAWQRAFRARAAFEAASGVTRVDSRELRRWLRSYRAALNAVTGACVALENNLPSQPSTVLSHQFVVAVDDFVDALRGAPPNPATPWTIDIAEVTAANQRVRDVASRFADDNSSARVLVSELAAITRSLSGIAASREPVYSSDRAP